MKKRKIASGLLAVVMLLGTMPALANEPGSDAGQFLMIAPSARGAALGGALTAGVTDIDALWWNPAGLGTEQGRQLQFVHAPWFEDITYNYLAYLHEEPVWGGRFAGALTLVDYGDIDITRINGQNPVTNLGKTDADDVALTLGYGRAETLFDWGISVKYIHESLAAHDADAFAFDFGVRRDNILSPGLSLGATLRNVGTQLEFVRRGDDLPLTFTAGAMYKFPEYPLRVSGDIVVPRDDRLFGNAGIEWWPVPLLALRAGYSGDNDAGNGLTVGFGINLHEEFFFDYAFVPYGDLGEAHRIALRYQFAGGERSQLAVGSEQPLAAGTPPREEQHKPPPAQPEPGEEPLSAVPLAVEPEPGEEPLSAVPPAVEPEPVVTPAPAVAQETEPAVVPLPTGAAEAEPAVVQPGNNANDYIRAGFEFYNQGSFHLAVRSYEQALRVDPDNQTALFNLGTVYYKLGDLRSAATSFERLTRVASRDAEAFAWLGVCRYYAGDRAKAMAAFTMARRLDPNNAIAAKYLPTR